MVEAAARSGHFDTVSFVLQNAPDCAFKTDSDLHSNLRKILEIACWTAQADLIQLVWEKMKRNNTIRAADLLEPLVLRQAVERGHIHIVKLLLSYGADPTLREDDRYMTVALQAAAKDGDLEMIEIILPRNRENYILRALYPAVENGNIDIVHRLLKWDSSNINVSRSRHDETLLHLAVRSGEMEIVKFLLDNGADVNAIKESFGSRLRSTVLQEALFSQHIETIQLILCQKTLASLIA
ncbi:ankyrin repeat-containing domain protein [Morchella snyderi]|nr:ankyrin repeat-containing domain protein [Morchella snyderi]